MLGSCYDALSEEWKTYSMNKLRFDLEQCVILTQDGQGPRCKHRVDVSKHYSSQPDCGRHKAKRTETGLPVAAVEIADPHIEIDIRSLYRRRIVGSRLKYLDDHVYETHEGAGALGGCDNCEKSLSAIANGISKGKSPEYVSLVQAELQTQYGMVTEKQLIKLQEERKKNRQIAAATHTTISRS